MGTSDARVRASVRYILYKGIDHRKFSSIVHVAREKSLFLFFAMPSFLSFVIYDTLIPYCHHLCNVTRFRDLLARYATALDVNLTRGTNDRIYH